LRALNIRPGSRVAVPALTYVATVAAIKYVGAEPIFIDVDDTWTMNPRHLEAEMNVSPIVCVIPVHLYGVMADMSRICEIALEHGAWVVEDAAQGLFAQWHGRPAGSWGDIATFSFYANKIITTAGEGGACATGPGELADRLRLLRGQAQDPQRRYWHTEVGYNYRITAMQAAFGQAQLFQSGDFLMKRRVIGQVYRLAFTGKFDTQCIPDECTPVDWLYTLLVPHGVHRDDVMARLDSEFEIETRPAFPSVASMPSYQTRNLLPVTTDVAVRGISLPTHAAMTTDDATRVVEAFITCCEEA
jgi:perosamine synthetase